MEYEVTPDEKRKEYGQELLDTYLNPKVSRRVAQGTPKSYISLSISPKSLILVCALNIFI